MSFNNKVVVVTGASSGIGAAIAIAFSAAGAKVVMVGRNESKLAAVAARCTEPLVVRVDITKDAPAVIEETIKKFGQLDILINNAGLSVGARILRGDMMKAYDTIMNTNLRAVVQLTTLAAPYLLKTKGNIVNISSVGGIQTPVYPEAINYCASKAALTHFGTCAAVELAQHGVRVNTVSPGPVRTDSIENTKVPVSWDDHKKLNCLQRVSEPGEIADVVLFLASDKAKGITGSNYVVDNGTLIKPA